jgi:hypothetical protein
VLNKTGDILSVSTDPTVLRLATLVEASLTSEGPLNLQGSGTSLKTIWSALQAEVHELICTESSRYKNERALFETTSKPVIALLAAYLTREFGVEASTAAGLASLSLLLPFRMAAGAWCRAYSTPAAMSADIEELGKLREESKKAK